MVLLATLYPETKGKTLEEMDGVFGKGVLEGDEGGERDEREAGVDEEVVDGRGKL